MRNRAHSEIFAATVKFAALYCKVLKGALIRPMGSLRVILFLQNSGDKRVVI